ncbi:unnamed protein product, partial [Ranitomeya imitator]
ILSLKVVGIEMKSDYITALGVIDRKQKYFRIFWQMTNGIDFPWQSALLTWFYMWIVTRFMKELWKSLTWIFHQGQPYGLDKETTHMAILRYRQIKRRCSDIDNDADRCSIAVWSLESCHTDISPATNDAEVPG